MTASLQAKSNGTQGALLVNGSEAVVFDSSGITSGAGRRLAQIQTFQTGAVATGTTTIPLDDTIPQITEGDQYMTLAFTPINASSTLEIDITSIFGNNTAARMICALFQDAVSNALAVCTQNIHAGTAVATLTFKHVMTAGTTSAITFRVRAGSSAAGTTTFNGSASVREFGGTMASRITIKEYLP